MNELHITIEFETLDDLRHHFLNIQQKLFNLTDYGVIPTTSGVLFEESDYAGNYEVSLNAASDI